MRQSTRSRDAELAARQQRLLIRSAELRVALAHQSQALQQPLALAMLRPRRALAWATRLWWGLGLYKQARRWLQRGD